MLKKFDSKRFHAEFQLISGVWYKKILCALYQEDSSIPKKELRNRIVTFFQENETGVPPYIVPRVIEGFISAALETGLLKGEKDNYSLM